MTHADLRRRLGAYADGTLADGEVEVVRAHLATGCTECLRDVFTRPVGMPRAPVVIRERARPTWGMALGVAAAVGVCAGALVARSGGGRGVREDPRVVELGNELGRLRVEHDHAEMVARKRIGRLESEVREVQAHHRPPTVAEAPPVAERAGPAATGAAEANPSWLGELGSSDGARTVTLAPGDDVGGASGYAIWSPSRGLVVVAASSLPTGGRPAVYRARVTMSDQSTVWVGDLTASAHGALVVSVTLPPSSGRRVIAIDLYRDPPGAPVLTGRVRS